MSLTGSPAEAAKVGISVADIAAGRYAYSGILTARYRRAVTGWVSAVEVSLFEALAEWMGSPAYYTRYSGRQPARVGAQHATIAPYGPFTTADDETVMLAIQNEREWHAFCRIVLDDPDIADDPRFITNSVAQFVDHPVLAGRDRWRTVAIPGGDIQALLPPATLTNLNPVLNPVPALGEHTEEILSWLGRSDDAIAAMRAEGVI